MRLDSDRFPPTRAMLDDFTVGCYHRPFGGGGGMNGGDRFALFAGHNALAFYLADAGQGEKGATLWRECGPFFDQQWEALPSSGDLAGFASAVNAHLYDQPGTAQLCMTVGILMADGRLRFTNCGYRTHALVTTDAGPWSPPEDAPAFGLKLGWVRPKSWDGNPRAFVDHVIHGVRRLVLISDGFLGAGDPEEMLPVVRQLGAATAGMTLDDVDAHFQALPHENDDAAMVIIEAGT